MSIFHAPASLALLASFIIFSMIALRVAPQLMATNALRPYWMIKKRRFEPLITHGFLHNDIGHLLVNSLTLFSFGPPLERTIGTARFVALYFSALLISGGVVLYRNRKDPDYAAVGASGAILAVLFAFILYYPKSMVGLFFVLPLPAVLFAFGYLAYSWWASKHSRGMVGHEAHLVGALTGLLFVTVTDVYAWVRAFKTMSS